MRHLMFNDHLEQLFYFDTVPFVIQWVYKPLSIILSSLCCAAAVALCVPCDSLFFPLPIIHARQTFSHLLFFLNFTLDSSTCAIL